MSTGLFILLIAVGLIGMLPLALVLRRYYILNLIKQHGATGNGIIDSVQRLRNKSQLADLIHYYYYDSSQQAHRGVLRTKVGKYKRNHVFTVYYYPPKPKWHTIAGEDRMLFFLLLVVALAIFVWFAVYKLYVEISS